MFAQVAETKRPFFDARDVGKDPLRELKWFDFDTTEMTAGTGGTKLVGTINGIPQGTGQSQRVGIRIIIMKLEIRFYCEHPADAITAAGEEILRLIVHLDTQANKAHATENSIMGGGADFLSFQLPDNMGRYYFVFDQTIDLNAFTAVHDAAVGPANKSYSRGKALYLSTDCYIPIDFQIGTTSGAFTTIMKNNLGILIYSRGGTVTCTARTRVWYLD